MKKSIAAIVGILVTISLVSAVCPLPVQGWAGYTGWELHADMAEDALNGARVGNGLPLTEDEIGRIAGQADAPDRHEGGKWHRVTYFDDVWELYGGKDGLAPGVKGAEQWAFDHIKKARDFYANNKKSDAEKELGYAIHYIQDAVCPAHVFPFEEGFVSAHLSFESITNENYRWATGANWRALVASATPISISSAEDLRQKLINAAHEVNNTLTAAFRAPNGKDYIAKPGEGISRVKKASYPHYHWDVSDDDIGLAMEKAAQLVKGAAIWATTGLTPPAPPTIAYVYSSWGMWTMMDEMSYLTSIEPDKYTFTWYNEVNIDDLWSNLNNHNILLIDEDTFYSDWWWSELGGPLYDSFRNHSSDLKAFVENGGAVFTGCENDLYLRGAGEDPKGVWWDWLPEGMQVKSYDPGLTSSVHVVPYLGAPQALYEYPNTISDYYLSQGHTHGYFTSYPGYTVTVRRNDNNEAMELFGVFGKGCIVVSHVEAEAGSAWEYLQNQLDFIVPSTSYKMEILSPLEGSIVTVGQEVTIRVAIYDSFYNPVYGATVSATSPTGVAIPLPEIINSPGTGIYEGTYTILPSDPIGDWGISIVASVGGEFPKQAINTEVVPVIDVSVDIKPGTYPNPINLKSKGVIPVAILTTADFDAGTVDGTSVRFGPSEAVAAHHALEDVDRDGDIDMILQFNTLQTGIQTGDTEATLTGQTLGGMYITGTDSVKVVQPK